MALIALNPADYSRLHEVAHWTHDARVLRRAQALLWLSDGDDVDDVAERLFVTRQTVYRWVKRFQQRHGLGLEARLSDWPREGRPRTVRALIEPLIEQVLEQDPRAFGYPMTIWTAPLLCRYLKEHHQVETSRRSVSAALARLDISWKRPRHDLGRRSPTWRQAKGG